MQRDSLLQACAKVIEEQEAAFPHSQAQELVLVLQEEDDAAGGHEPQLLVKALGVADLTLHADAGKARAVQVGAVCEPRVPS